MATADAVHTTHGQAYGHRPRLAAGSSVEALEDVRALNTAVTGAALEDSIRRGRSLAAQAEARLAEAQQASTSSKVRAQAGSHEADVSQVTDGPG